MLTGYWLTLSANLQDVIIFVLLFSIPLIIAGILFFRQAPLLLIKAMILRFGFINLVFVFLIGVSVALSVSLTAQERALRQASSKAADSFDLVVTAPGSKINALMSVVYLQKNEMPLLGGRAFNRIFNHPQVAVAAPLAFADSYHGASIVGTTSDFINLISGQLQQGQIFEHQHQGVIGFSVNLKIGDVFTPEHVSAHQPVLSQSRIDRHENHGYKIVGKMSYTGTPWDEVILVPIEGVWSVHGIGGDEHQAIDDHGDVLGPPYSVAEYHGAQAIVVKAKKMMANYALKREFTTPQTMAIFPGAVLSQLHEMVGNVQKLLSLMTIVTQVLVVLSVMTSFVILNRLFSKHIAMLNAIGAPARYVFAVIWGYAASLISLGCGVGLIMAVLLNKVISNYLSNEINVNIEASLNWQEWHLIAVFCAGSAIFALIPPLISLRTPILEQLRQ